MPDALRARIEGKMAIHSARGGYAPSGMYGTRDAGRSMDIRSGEEALATQTHPIIRKHPETVREGLFGCAGYIIGIEARDDAEALPLRPAESRGRNEVDGTCSSRGAPVD